MNRLLHHSYLIKMKLAAFFILVKSTAAAEEPDTGSEIFCPLRFQIMERIYI